VDWGYIKEDTRVAMSRRKQKEFAVPANIKAGLTSIIAGNETIIASMLDVPSESTEDLLNSILSVMQMNSLSAEMLLGSFFQKELLSTYCVTVLNKSGKGGEATLAGRIASCWARPDFKAGISDVVKDVGSEDVPPPPTKKLRLEEENAPPPTLVTFNPAHLAKVASLCTQYASAEPFPHIVLHDVLENSDHPKHVLSEVVGNLKVEFKEVSVYLLSSYFAIKVGIS